MQQMKAIRIIGPEAMRLVDVEVPRPGVGEVLLKIVCVGYCGSDLSTYLGKNPLVSYPRIPGHELSGEIVEIGEGANASWSVGDRALVLPYTSCGQCSACKQARFNACRHNETLGVQRDGGLAEYLVVPVGKLMRSETLDYHELALVEPLTVGFHAVDRGRVDSADTVLVFGCGAIGLGAIAGAAERGARVIAVDLDHQKLAIAKQAGASDTIHALEQDVPKSLFDICGEDGPNVVIEAIGLPQTFRSAVELVGFAGRVIYVGYAKAPVEYESKFFVQKELDIFGSRNATPKDFKAVIRMLEAKRFPVDLMLSRTVVLGEAVAAMAEWAEAPQLFTKIQVRFD